ncbi:MAG: sulfite exporter TauE/SafE family protein [Candidatus Omnitrophota bacterium]
MSLVTMCSSFFLTGLAMGSGPCLLTCGPVLVSYIAGTKNSAAQGLACWSIFSLGRVLSVVFLSFLAGCAGSFLFRFFYWTITGYILWAITGFFICSLGIAIFCGRYNTAPSCCGPAACYLSRRQAKDTVLLGVLTGLMPCLPLAGVLSYISMVSTHFADGILFGLSFGIGVSVSALILMSMIAGAVPGFIHLRQGRGKIILYKLSGVILMIFGFHILFKILVEFISTK